MRMGPVATGLLACWAWIPSSAAAQLEASAGLLVLADPVVDGTQLGPSLAVSASLSSLGLPALLEFGVARTDFTVLGQDYHNDHYFLTAVTQWQVAEGSTSFAFRFGLGAYGEYQTVESDPPVGGGDNWAETAVAGAILTHEIAPGVRVLLTLTDALVGPFNAAFDPDEYSIEHRVRIAIGVGVRF